MAACQTISPLGYRYSMAAFCSGEPMPHTTSYAFPDPNMFMPPPQAEHNYLAQEPPSHSAEPSLKSSTSSHSPSPKLEPHSSAVYKSHKLDTYKDDAKRKPKVSNGCKKATTGVNARSSASMPGPIPATKPVIMDQDRNGVRWISFDYSRDRVKSNYQIRCDVDSVSVYKLGSDFKLTNCVYPRAYEAQRTKSHYKGNRFNYETDCNEVGWALAELNPDLRGKRGLIQRAVDSWRNSSRDEAKRSRRVRRMDKAESKKRYDRRASTSMLDHLSTDLPHHVLDTIDMGPSSSSLSKCSPPSLQSMSSCSAGSSFPNSLDGCSPQAAMFNNHYALESWSYHPTEHSFYAPQTAVLDPIDQDGCLPFGSMQNTWYSQ